MSEAKSENLGGETELPSYSISQGQASTIGNRRTEHQRTLENGKGRVWLSLFVHSRAANGASIPAFYEGDDITGRVEINLDKAETIKAITISIVGGTTFVGQEEEKFMNEEKVLWAPPIQGGSKISGQHSWGFAFRLPAEIEVKESAGKKGSYRLPPSFLERASAAYIDYKLVATVKRGMLRVNQTLLTNLVHLPVTFPEPPSPLRRLAYEKQSPLIGPDGDPEGWSLQPPVKLRGSLFGTKNIEIDCTLAIASPLSYAVGSPIPLFLIFKGSDAQALDLISKPSSIRVRLLRGMATGNEAVDDNGVRRTDNHFLQVAGQAYFWPAAEGSDREGERRLHGELELAKTLKPSFKFPKFAIRYTVELLSFIVPGFVAEVKEEIDTVLVSRTVEIATKQMPGVITHSYAPPGYEKPIGTDYNNSVGLLEIGNQRFVHYHHGSLAA